MKKNLYLIYLFLAVIALPCYAGENEIVIQLETDTKLLPIYIADIKNSDSAFSNDYIKQLKKVLLFDFNHNGMTYAVSDKKDVEAILAAPDPKMKMIPAHYAVRLAIKEKRLGADLISVNSNSLKGLEGFNLTGNLEEDRKTIHRISDAILRELFNMDGIAGTRILFTKKYQAANDNTWYSDIWECDYDGKNAKKILGDAGYCVTPKYIPSKAGYLAGSLLFVSYKNGQPKIFLSTIKEPNIQRLTYLRGNQLMPAISQKRDKVAFISDVTGNPDLFIMDFNPEKGEMGKPRQIYATRQASQGSPTFNPEGNKIAFVSNKDGTPRVYVMAIPEEGVKLKDIKTTLISKLGRESTAPSWSPDGTKIAYCSMLNGIRQICVYDVRTGEERQITVGAGNKENPCWAPNSLHLAYNTTGKESELYIVNLNQPEAVKISSGPGEKHFPSWEPRS